MSTFELEREYALALAKFRDETVIDRIRRELYAAGEVIAKVRVAVDQIDAALTAYDTLPGDTEPAPTVPEHEDPARLRGQLADAHADCARYAAERDAARAERDQLADALLAAYLQLPDETRGGAQ